MALVYTLINNGTEYEVANGSCVVGSVVIPSVYEGKPVTSIGRWAFSNQQVSIIPPPACTTLTNITIPSSVKTIKTGAFSRCTGLISVNIEGNEMISIGTNAFSNCINLTNIRLPDSITALGDSAFEGEVFYYCESLKYIDLPKNLLVISQMTFKGCANLKELEIKENVKEIQSLVFENTFIEKIYFRGNAPIFALYALFSFGPKTLYRKKNFVTGWPDSVQGVPVVLWSNNVVKSGGTGKLITKKRN
jgi:hypothetical protein